MFSTFSGFAFLFSQWFDDIPNVIDLLTFLISLLSLAVELQLFCDHSKDVRQSEELLKSVLRSDDKSAMMRMMHGLLGNRF